MGANELSMLLWRERELLELLLFKLEEQELLLAAGRSRWTQFATREIEQVLEGLREAGITRLVEVEAIAAEWGAPEGAGIRDLIEVAPTAAWRDVLTGHLHGLTKLTDEVARLREGNSERLRAVLRATQETLSGLGETTGEYTTQGERARGDSARIVDTEM
ncbi:flagellar export chaperone FlgN [Microbacterium sp. ARD32]|uniref:flagellar export chaperone FlgN n=1 Tax=Microbacterium sp. ARD32 TaxID=2962577 RepID=UPI00288234FC|nr:flagellar export chaperone FlgN [Microbacterium sp. ARD32]MDT0156382.1 flagellar export chaperone FlgN [Microbacterium sp. ARD32]